MGSLRWEPYYNDPKSSNLLEQRGGGGGVGETAKRAGTSDDTAAESED